MGGVSRVRSRRRGWKARAQRLEQDVEYPEREEGGEHGVECFGGPRLGEVEETAAEEAIHCRR